MMCMKKNLTIEKEKTTMNNKTILEIKIKQRGDGVYDLYVDDKWIASQGHYENIIEVIREEIKRIDNEVHSND